MPCKGSARQGRMRWDDYSRASGSRRLAELTLSTDGVADSAGLALSVPWGTVSPVVVWRLFLG